MQTVLSSLCVLALAGLPLLCVFPASAWITSASLNSAVQRGYSCSLVVACSGLLAVAGAVALKGYRRGMWVLFAAVCFTAWAQGELLRRQWPIWVMDRSAVLTTAFLMNWFATLAIPAVVLARRLGIRVEPIIAAGFSAALFVQMILLAVQWVFQETGLDFLGVVLGVPVSGAQPPVMDSLGVRTTTMRGFGAGLSPN
jgi:hypothetical protein